MQNANQQFAEEFKELSLRLNGMLKWNATISGISSVVFANGNQIGFINENIDNMVSDIRQNSNSLVMVSRKVELNSVNIAENKANITNNLLKLSNIENVHDWIMDHIEGNELNLTTTMNPSQTKMPESSTSVLTGDESS